MKDAQKVHRSALYLLFFSVNFEAWDPLDTNGFFSVSKLFGLVYLVTILPSLKKYIIVKSIRDLLNSIGIFLFLLTIISLLNINEISSTFFNFSIFQNIILFWFLLNQERMEPGSLEKGLISFALGSIVVAILFTLGAGTLDIDGRITLFGDNENVIGLRMAISIIFLLFFTFQNKFKQGKKRYVLILAVPIMLQLMAETGSRVAFISLASSLLVGLILFKTKHVWSKVLSFAIGIAMLIGAWFIISQSEVLMVRLLKTQTEGNIGDRDDIWQKILPVVSQNPVLGVGETGYALYSKQKFGELQSPHNVFLEILCYTGIVGLTIYLLFLLKMVGIAIKHYRYNNNLIPILFLFPILGMLLSGQLLTNKIGWILFAYIGSSVFTFWKRIDVRNDKS